MTQAYLQPFKKALQSLRLAVDEDLAKAGHYAPFVRDATIQRFEYTFEQAWKAGKIFLQFQIGKDVQTASEVFRKLAEVGVLKETDEWDKFQRARNKTSHTYNEITAEDVYEMAKNFVGEAEALLQKLQGFPEP
jgi:nucleotidyltransferase substrate binding protein (TIGR01987 family)